MQNYAVVKVGERQYIVEPNKTYTIDKFVAEVGDKLDFEVLAVSTEGNLTIDADKLSKAKATVEVVDQAKGEKIKTFVYKAKSRYRRRHGFRKRVTTFKVLNIG